MVQLTTRKGGNCDALQLEGRTMTRQLFWAVLAKLVLHMRRTPISELLVKILTLPLVSATPI